MTKLGRGLEALINPGPDTQDQTMGVTTLRISEIVPNKYQPRRSFDQEKLQELANSLRENGLIQPIIVTKRDDSLYELIAGERRLEASKLAGFREVPVIIRSVTPKEQLQFAIIENVQREDLNAIEVAQAFQQLNEEFHLTHAQISEIVGKDRVTVSNFIRLLKLNNKIQNMILNNSLSSGHARAILQVDEGLQEGFAEMIIRNKYSVRKAESEAKQIKERGSLSNRRPLENKNELYQKYEDKLALKFKTKISIRKNRNQGKITIYFNGGDDLKRIIDEIEK
jgi:ParB family transcriptional regulator, chromosome partitioning protein